VGFGQHNPRHTFRRNMKKTGASLEDQGAAMGHSKKNLEQTLNYGSEGRDHAAELAPYVEKAAAILCAPNDAVVLNGNEAGSGNFLNSQLSASDVSQIIQNQKDSSQFNKSPIY
jgi:hypothetical protein